jgi:hypothetical protein
MTGVASQPYVSGGQLVVWSAQRRAGPIRLWFRSQYLYNLPSSFLVRFKMVAMLCQLWLVCFSVFVPLTQCDLVSTDIALWESPRAALIRDAIYLEGGLLEVSTAGEPSPYVSLPTSERSLPSERSTHDRFPRY